VSDLSLKYHSKIPPLQYLALLTDFSHCSITDDIRFHFDPSNVYHFTLLQDRNHRLPQIKVVDLSVCFSSDKICTRVSVASLARDVQDLLSRWPI